jgi:hypothetical protein
MRERFPRLQSGVSIRHGITPRLRLCYQACGQHSQRQQRISPSTDGLVIPDAKYFRSSSPGRIRGLDQAAARISGRWNCCSRTLTDDLKSAGACDASAGLAVLHPLRGQFVQAAECAERHRRALPAASRHHCSTPAPHSGVARFSEADEFAWMTCMFPSSRVLCRCDTSSCFPGLRF